METAPTEQNAQTGCELHTSWNLTSLAEEMILDIQAAWKTPFESPVVLFSDRKVEQWFRQFWLKSDAGKNGAIMNLACLATENFLFSMLTDRGVKKLSTELLCDLLVAKLPSVTEDNVPYYKTLGSEEVNAYIEQEDGTVNEIHLYDFSEQLAALLIDYETTRPANYHPTEVAGVVNAWKNGSTFFGASGVALESWQRKLYNDLLASPLTTHGATYATLGAVFTERLTHPKNGRIFSCKLRAPVYLFGFSGMGQLHRTILQAFSREHLLKVYLQGSEQPISTALVPAPTQADAAPNTEEAAIITHWSAFGSENISWWASWSQKKSGASRECVLPLLKKISAHTHITKAASKIREIEYVHSKICALLSSAPKNGTPPVLQSDILVLAPDIASYRTAILEVFDENAERFSSHFPSVPYRILDLSSTASQVCTALHTLIAILEKKSISRPDFFSLVRSPFVQRVRGITPRMADTWLSWVEAMHLYRTHNGTDDWTQGVKRLLLSRLTEKPVTESNGALIIPYSDFETADDSTLERFVACIESLENALHYFAEKTNTPSSPAGGANASGGAQTAGGANTAGSTNAPCSVSLTQDDLGYIRTFFDSWLLYTDNADQSLVNEQLVYRHICEELDRQALLFDLHQQITTLSLKGVTLALKAAAQAAQGTNSVVFTGGITFASFQPNRILPAKYVFIIGLDSKAFPGVDRKNNLDLRSFSEPWLCDNSVSAKNRYSFLCQLLATENELFVSYVDSDLQKDETFYCSSVVNELMRFAQIPESAITALTVDETRSWSELFTSRAIRNKTNYLQLNRALPQTLSSSEGSAQADLPAAPTPPSAQEPASAIPSTAAPAAAAQVRADEQKTPPDRVSLSALVAFLTDPFQFRITTLFSKDTSEEATEERTELEPITLSPLVKAKVINAYARALLALKKQEPEKTLSVENAEPYLERSATEEALYQAGVLPEKEPFGKKAWRDALQEVCNICVQLSALDIQPQTLVPSGSVELRIEGNAHPWMLTGDLQPYWITGSALTVVAILTGSKKPKDTMAKAYLKSYLTALSVALSKNEPLSVTLVACHSAWKTAKKGATGLFSTFKTFSVTPEEARTVLNALYEDAYIKKICTCVPFDLYADETKPAPESLFELKLKLKDNVGGGIWRYFPQKDLFDPMKDIGYTPADFSDLWKKACAAQKKRCLFL